MDNDRARLFLLSIAAVPLACGGRGLPGGAAPGQPIPVDDDVDGLPGYGDDSPAPGFNPGSGGCEAWIQAQLTCGYGYGYDDGGAPAETGYDGYDYQDDYDNNYPSPYSDEFCPYYLGLLTERYGAACAAATDALLGCLAMFACQDLDVDTFENLCASAALAAASACDVPQEPPPPPETSGVTNATIDPDTTDPTDPTDPTMGDGCPQTGTYTVSGSCGVQFDNCPDGNSYELTCTPPADPAGLHTCVCEMNGTQTATFEIENPCNTIWEQLANTSCGYPTAT